MKTNIDKLICWCIGKTYHTDAEIAAMPMKQRLEIAQRAADDAAVLLMIVVFPALLIAFCLIAF